MNTIAVIVEYDSGSKRQRFMLPTDVTTEKLSTTIARRLELPAEDSKGTPTEYRLRHKRRGRGLSCRGTLKAARVKEDDVLQLECHRRSHRLLVAVLILVLLIAFSIALLPMLSG